MIQLHIRLHALFPCPANAPTRPQIVTRRSCARVVYAHKQSQHRRITFFAMPPPQCLDDLKERTLKQLCELKKHKVKVGGPSIYQAMLDNGLTGPAHGDIEQHKPSSAVITHFKAKRQPACAAAEKCEWRARNAV